MNQYPKCHIYSLHDESPANVYHRQDRLLFYEGGWVGIGYRPNKSAHQAIEQCRINCMKYSWVIDLDIKGFFDTIDHELLLNAVQFYTQEKHI